MSIQGVDSVLSQLRALQSRSRELTPGPSEAAAPEVDFSAELGKVVQAVNTQQQATKDVSTAFVQGAQDVELADVMLALNKADVSFRTLAEVRNRLVSAYQDIMNMPI